MKIRHYFAVFALLGAFSAVSVRAALKFEQTDIFLAANSGKADLRADFPFINVGTEDVEIRDLLSTCGCTVANLEKRRYAPGEGGSIRVIFTPGERTGPQSKSVRVVLVGGDSVDLRVNATIAKVFATVRRVMHWKRDAPPEPKSLDIEIVREQPLSLETVTSSSPIIVTSLETIEAGRHYRVVLTPTVTSAPVKAIVTVASGEGDSDVPTLRLLALIR